MFLVPIKDNTWHPVIDYRKLNSVTVSDRFPLPVLADLLQSLGEHNTVFSSLDLISGYWQVPLAPESRPLTAFSTPSGHFEYLRLPFGLRNAPLIFQRLINEVFRGMLGKNVFAYLDDVIVVDKNVPDHLSRLSDVFARLKSAGLKVKLTKCQFLKKRLAFLGHVVDSEGLHTSDCKIKAIVDFPRPSSVSFLRNFFGTIWVLQRVYPPLLAPCFPSHKTPAQGYALRLG